MPDWLIVGGLVLLSLFPRVFLLATKSFEIFHADYAIYGLMARHILEGKWMVYYYGQGYMGSLEAFVAALLFSIRGMDIVSVLMVPLVFYVLFIPVNYFLLRNVFGREVSVTANLLLALPPPALTRLSVAGLGGYPETLFFGSLMLLGLVLYSSRRNKTILFPAGLAAGIGLWTNNLILMYFIPLLFWMFLRSRFWKNWRPGFGWRSFFLLRGISVPPSIRGVALVIQTIVCLYLLLNLLSVFFGPTLSLGGLEWKLPSIPFHVKKLKKILLLILGEAAVVSFFAAGVKGVLKKFKPCLPFAAGFFLGALPMIGHSLAGGEGYRLIHGSGVITLKQLPAQFALVMGRGLVEDVWGISRLALGAGGLRSLSACLMLGSSAGLFLFFLWDRRKELRSLLALKAAGYTPSIFVFLLTLVGLLICLLNNLPQAGRYLSPLFFSFSTIFALSLISLWKKARFTASFLLVFFLAYYVHANVQATVQIKESGPVKKAYAEILNLAREKDLRGGWAHYVMSYVLTFQSGEKVIVAPYRSPDRYPAYTKFVNGLDRVFYVFEDEDPFLPNFQRVLDGHRISYEKIWKEPFTVFVIDRRKRSEKEWV